MFSLLGTTFAQDGCFYKAEHNYLHLGAMRYMSDGANVCSKLETGEYVWLQANDFDKSGGCWYVDKYPVSAIKDMNGTLKQCVLTTENNYEWTDYK